MLEQILQNLPQIGLHISLWESVFGQLSSPILGSNRKKKDVAMDRNIRIPGLNSSATDSGHRHNIKLTRESTNQNWGQDFLCCATLQSVRTFPEDNLTHGSHKWLGVIAPPRSPCCQLRPWTLQRSIGAWSGHAWWPQWSMHSAFRHAALPPPSCWGSGSLSTGAPRALRFLRTVSELPIEPPTKHAQTERQQIAL